MGHIVKGWLEGFFDEGEEVFLTCGLGEVVFFRVEGYKLGFFVTRERFAVLREAIGNALEIVESVASLE